MANETYLEELAEQLAKTEIPEFHGASGYFSKPQPNLDPAIFEGETVKFEVSEHIIRTLLNFWHKRGYHHASAWTTIWLAGSGVSYQWAGDRGNGDLDVLMGIDWPLFYTCNPQWGQTGIEQVTKHIDDELRTHLWPRTAHTDFGGKEFEVTYFVNLDATDIRDILPYAAYELTSTRWTVRPSHDTAYDHPEEPQWLPYARVDLEAAMTARTSIRAILSDLPHLDGSYRVTALNRLASAVQYAVGMMTDIHGNRRKAFTKPLGKGYWDFNNWRWQKAKQTGVVKVLGAIEHAHTKAIEAAEEATYSAQLASADELVIRAAMAYRDVS
ncbi:hypothetical protein ACFYP4_02925 [Streptomyces sp. NPDC005551]|uniref:hypothetical protein n=1 Tax=Streptomyces sp. NPDC005551 TaxID=3364725 RepID=UPI0036B4CC8B